MVSPYPFNLTGCNRWLHMAKRPKGSQVSAWESSLIEEPQNLWSTCIQRKETLIRNLGNVKPITNAEHQSDVFTQLPTTATQSQPNRKYDHSRNRPHDRTKLTNQPPMSSRTSSDLLRGMWLRADSKDLHWPSWPSYLTKVGEVNTEVFISRRKPLPTSTSRELGSDM